MSFLDSQNFVQAYLPQRSFARMDLTTFPEADRLKHYATLSFEFNPITSLETLPSLSSLKVLDISNTDIDSFEGAQSQPNLERLYIKNTPLSKYHDVRIMCLIVFGPSLVAIDNSPLTSFELKIGKFLSSTLRNYLRNAWVITGLYPVKMMNLRTLANKKMSISLPVTKVQHERGPSYYETNGAVGRTMMKPKLAKTPKKTNEETTPTFLYELENAAEEKPKRKKRTSRLRKKRSHDGEKENPNAGRITKYMDQLKNIKPLQKPDELVMNMPDFSSTTSADSLGRDFISDSALDRQRDDMASRYSDFDISGSELSGLESYSGKYFDSVEDFLPSKQRKKAKIRRSKMVRSKSDIVSEDSGPRPPRRRGMRTSESSSVFNSDVLPM